MSYFILLEMCTAVYGILITVIVLSHSILTVAGLGIVY